MTDVDRMVEIKRKRDNFRAANDAPRIRPGSWKRVEPELVVGEDVTPNGSLAGVTHYQVVGWKSNSEKDPGITRECLSPGEAALEVRSLLVGGCYQIIVESPVNRPT